MKVDIDFSVIVVDEAYGNVSGALDFPVIPAPGDYVSLVFPTSNGKQDFINWSGLLKITERVFRINDGGVSVSLSDATLSSVDEAVKLLKFLEQNYDLFSVQYNI